MANPIRKKQDSQPSKERLDEVLGELGQLMQGLISKSPDELLQRLPEKVCELLSVPICILWKRKPATTKFSIASFCGDIDEKYQKTELDVGHPSVRYVLEHKILALDDVNEATYRLADIDQINKRGWTSFLSVPLKAENDVVGILDVFTQTPRHFVSWEKALAKTLGHYASIGIQKAIAVQGQLEISDDREKLQEIMVIMSKMTAASESSVVWRLLQEGVTKMVGPDPIVEIGRLNYVTKQLETVESNLSEADGISSGLTFGKGLVDRALEEKKTIIAKDVRDKQWADVYRNRWPSTRSEMTVPISIRKVPIRQGIKVKTGTKQIGIINIESPKVNDFPETYERRLQLLAYHAALRLEGIESHHKLVAIREIEKKIVNAQNYDSIIKTVVSGITDILGFEWVNVSLIDLDRTTIRSDYVVGLRDSRVEMFKGMACHSLNSNDIQADIVRSKQIEVLDSDDPRLDSKIFDSFNHKDFVRVYIPMIEPSRNLVIGTIETGYSRKYRSHIYEQDIQVLKSFVDYAVHALERKKSGLIDRVSHELRSPIVGIRSHASFLQTRFSDIRLTPNKIAVKLQDILTDCDLLLYQVDQFEYLLGRGASKKPRFEQIDVSRDIVIKTVNQLHPVLNEHGFPKNCIEYRLSQTARAPIRTDKVLLNQVVYNLLINSVKYAERDTETFKILLEVSTHSDSNSYIISIKDWGIGIRKGEEKKIFQEGFRSSDAVKKAGGSGLGLSISNEIMGQLGGRLELRSSAKPTEFRLTVPRK